MVELVGNLEFIAELLQSLLVEGAIELDSHVDVGQQIMCQPDIAEAALS